MEKIFTAALGADFKAASSTLKNTCSVVEHTLPSFLKALSFQGPSPFLIKPLKTAIALGSVGAVHALLDAPDASAALPTLAEDGTDWPSLRSNLCKQPSFKSRSISTLLVKAFLAHGRSDLVYFPALVALTQQDESLLAWLLKTAASVSRVFQDSYLVCTAVKAGCNGALQQLLSLGNQQWDADDLLDGLEIAAASGQVATVQLLIQASDQWTKHHLTEVLFSAKKQDVVAALLASTPQPWEPADLKPALEQAARAGSIELVQQFLEAVGEVGWSPDDLVGAVEAAAAGKHPIVTLDLLAATAGPWQRAHLSVAVGHAARWGDLEHRSMQRVLAVCCEPWNGEGLQLGLSSAADAGHWGMLGLLLEANPAKWSWEQLGSPLLAAAKLGAHQPLQQLLAAPASGALQFQHLQPAMKVAIEQGNDAILCQLTECLGSVPPEELSQLLAKAARIGAAGAVQLLLSASSEPWSLTCLLRGIRAAVEEGHVIALQHLIDAGAGRWEDRALARVTTKAADSGNTAMVLLLLTAKDGWEPEALLGALCSVARQGNMTLLKRLLGASGSWTQWTLYTAVQSGAKADQLVAVAALLDAGIVAGPVQEGPMGFTDHPWRTSLLAPALQAAAGQGNAAMAQTLLATSKNPWLNEQLQPAMICSMEGGSVDVMHLLLSCQTERWTRSQLIGLLTRAVACEDAGFMEGLLAMEGVVWDMDLLSKAIAKSARSGSADRVERLLNVPGVKYTKAFLKRLRDTTGGFQPAVIKAFEAALARPLEVNIGI
jgi:hypothetical protein